MYDIELSESFFPAQAGEPQRLMTIGQMLSRSADNHPNQPARFPKGAVLTHEGIVQNSYGGLSQIGVEAGDVVMHHMPLFHCMGCAILGCAAVAHGSTNLLAPMFDAEDQHTKTIYVREDAIVPDLDVWIGGLFDKDHLDATTAQLAAASGTAPDDHQARDLEQRRQLKECDANLSKYRALLEHDSDITIAATWIAEIERERRNLERELGRKPTPRKLTQNEIKALVVQLRDIVAVLADADPLDERAIYQELGVNLTYYPDGRVHVAAGAPHVLRVRVGGATPVPTTRPALLARWYTIAA